MPGTTGHPVSHDESFHSGTLAASPSLGAIIETRAVLDSSGALLGYMPIYDASNGPTSVTGLKLWARANSIHGLADGAAITTWPDISGQGNNLTGTASPTYKTGILNGWPVARLNGTTQWFRSAAFTGGDLAQPDTVFVVAKASAIRTQALISGRTSGKEQMMYHSNSGLNYTIFAGSNLTNGGGLPHPSTSSWDIWAGQPNGGSTKQWINGGAANASGAGGAQVLDGLSLGARYDNSLPFAGDIAEVLVYSGALTTTQLDVVGNYLAAKYALTWAASS